QQIIHQEVIKETGFKNRGLKEANFYLLRTSSMSAVLTENGFIDHPSDAAELKTTSFLNKIATGHVRGLASALGLKKRSSIKMKTPSFYTIKQGDTLWSLARKYKTTVLALKLLNKGIDPYRLQIGNKIKTK